MNFAQELSKHAGQLLVVRLIDNNELHMTLDAVGDDYARFSSLNAKVVVQLDKIVSIRRT